MKVRPSMKLARTVLGPILLPASVFLVGCGATPTGETHGGSGSTGSGGHTSPSGGSGNNPSAGSSSNPSGGSGNGSFGGAGNNPAGGSESGSLGGAGSTPNGGTGNGSFGGTAGTTQGSAGGKAAGGAGGKGGAGAGGASGGSTSTGSAGAAALNCDAPMPTGGTTVTSTNKTGKAGNLDWSIWTNSAAGSITTFSVPAFSASWTKDSGDYLARLGLQWKGDKTHAELGTIIAQFASKKMGSGGQYSYIGIYGWTLSPCVEWYIVDDSYNKMPVNPGNTQNKGMVTIDGGSYVIYKRSTNGTGGSKCGSSVTTWDQFYSVRQSSRACGQISISEHFKAWEAAGLTLGKMDQAQILVETGPESGSNATGGSVDFSTANVTVTPP
ncbi:MAG TPA: glycoside hydrolase family 11 protein [Polyangiaceae bacterium]|nr:glycoside hydrolase family 11 protein [Polyangiaceae bacterium]